MIVRKSTGTKSNHGNKSRISPIKPSKYIDMVVSALQSLKDRSGSIPKNIVGYIANTYDIQADRKVISSSVYRALKQGLDNDIILKHSDGHYKLAVKGKLRKVPAKKRRKKRKGKKKGKKKKRKKRKKAKKKSKKKGKRRRRKRRKSKKSKRRRKEREDSEEKPKRRRSRKKDHEAN